MKEIYERLKGIMADMIQKAGSGHYASSVTALQIMVPLFYEKGIEPDQFILSKGHAAPALYSILFDKGYLKRADLDSFREYGGLPGHPELGTNGVLCSSGSLGMGISKALGLAYASPEKEYHVLVGDGELQEGQNSEALDYWTANNVRNVIVHVDCNDIQYSGPLRPKLAGFNPRLIFHNTKWERDNSYLVKGKAGKLKYTDVLLNEMIFPARARPFAMDTMCCSEIPH